VEIVICGSVGAVCESEWVQGVWDDGVDVSATGRWSFRQVTLVFLGTGSMVVCLKHVGVTDWVREMLKLSVKTLAIWSAHAPSTRPGNPSGPAAL
jgi:hypothetical protein